MEPKVGMKLNTSWGYNMTINDYCEIVEISKTGKTVKCRMLNKELTAESFSPGGGKAKAGNKLAGPIFRLKVGKTKWGLSFHGSYPFCGAEELPIDTKMKDCSSRMGYFHVDNGGESYENHWD